MRLTCPNCGSECEIEGALIQESGQDLECPDCEHAWFETRRPSRDAKTGNAAVTLAQESAESTDGDGIRTDDPDPRSGDHSHAITDAGRHSLEATRALAVDRAALQVLKEEAERELSLRRSQESGSMDGPADDIRPAPGDAAPNKRSQASARKALARRNRGWIWTVALLVFMTAALAGLLIAIYLRAPAISQFYPNTEGPLQSYLEAANAFLDWLNRVLDR